MKDDDFFTGCLVHQGLDVYEVTSKNTDLMSAWVYITLTSVVDSSSKNLRGYWGTKFPDWEPVEIPNSSIWIPREPGSQVEVDYAVGGCVVYKACVSGQVMEDTEKDFLKKYYRLLWDIVEPQAKVEYGVNCIRCGQFYEHAEKVTDFQCWGCRNGY